MQNLKNYWKGPKLKSKSRFREIWDSVTEILWDSPQALADKGSLDSEVQTWLNGQKKNFFLEHAQWLLYTRACKLKFDLNFASDRKLQGNFNLKVWHNPQSFDSNNCHEIWFFPLGITAWG